MTQKNRTVVAILEDPRGSWTFCFPSTAMTVRNGKNELLTACDLLFSAFEDFVIPTRVSVNVQKYPRDTSIECYFNLQGDDELLDTDKYKLSDPAGVSSQMIRDVIPENPEFDYNISRVVVERANIRCFLTDGDIYVNRTENSARYHADEVVADRDGVSDPLNISLLFRRNFGIKEIDSEGIIFVRVVTWTDIWFEDTEIGRKNKKRLQAFFEQITGKLSVEYIRRESEWSGSELREVF